MSTFDNIKTNLEKVSDYLNLTHGKKELLLTHIKINQKFCNNCDACI